MWYALNAGPEHQEYFNWGILKSYNPERINQPNLNDQSGILVAVGIDIDAGEKPCEKIKCLEREMNNITLKKIPYDPIWKNSNAAAYTALKACKIPTIGLVEGLNAKLPWDWIRLHPGWGVDLSSPPSMWMAPPSCYDYPELCYPNPRTNI